MRSGIGRGMAAAALALTTIGTLSTQEALGETAPPRNVAVQNLGQDDTATLTQQRAVLFQRMLDRPDDLDAAFGYAALSVRLGDVEAAISTLERMLIYAPGLPRLQLELAVLYFRLNAYQSAEAYLEAALAQDLPPVVRQKAEALLARVQAGQDNDVFTAQVRAGVRYQSNANRVTQADEVALNGLLFALNPNAQGQDDWNAFVAGSLHYGHDLGGQGDMLELDVLAYGAKQRNLDELDTGILEVSVGPSFDLGRFDLDDTKLGLFAIGSGALLGGDPYFRTAGVGARLVGQPSPEVGYVLRAEWRYRWFENIGQSTTATDRSGQTWLLGGTLNRIVDPATIVTVNSVVRRTTAQVDYLQFTGAEVGATVRRSFLDPTGQSERGWVAALSGGFVLRDYDGPDPVLNPTFAQEDRELFISASLTVPLPQPNWAVIGEVAYRDVRSNYDLRDHDNASVTFSIVRKW